MASDWAKRNSRDDQIELAFRLTEKIAEMHHIANAIERGGFGITTHAYQLRDCARIFRAALGSAHSNDDESGR